MTESVLLDTNRVEFPKLGIGFNIDDTAFKLFGTEIKWYGILIVTGMLLAMLYAFFNMKKFGLNPDRAFDAVIAGIIGGMVGARVYYVLMSWEDYAGDWKAMINIRNGGLAIYGGIIGAVLVGGLVAKLRKVKLLPLLDIAGIGFLLGQGIGRWGNFTNQEAFGCNTDSIFGMTSGKIQQWLLTNSDSVTLSGDKVIDPFQPVHPCFLYESFWCLLGFVLLAVFAAKFRKYDGQIFLMYIGWYGLGRFFIEGLRIDSLMLGSLRVSQVLAAVCVVVSVILQIVIGSKVKRMGEDYQLYCNTEESRQLLSEADKKAEKESEKVESEQDEEKPESETKEENTSEKSEEE